MQRSAPSRVLSARRVDVSDATEHIAGWEAAGIIDRATADRLRTAGSVATSQAVEPDGRAPDRSAVSAMFGPSVTIAEAFAYLGGAFLLAAWSSLMVRGGASGDSELTIGVLSLVAAGALAGLGAWLRRGTERRSRAAGVAFLVAAAYVAAATFAFATWAGLEWTATAVVSAAVALLAAAGLRIVHPAVLTQIAVLTWLTALAASLLSWIGQAVFPETVSEVTGIPTQSGPDPIILVIASATWWLAIAMVIGLIGLREAGARDDPLALRRAAVSRFWAGITAVIGMSTAVTRTVYDGDDFSHQVLEPWVGVAALLILSAVLVERAFRRDATSYIYAAALGLIVALSYFNLNYLSDSQELALLLEGIILLGVGFGADRLRRRIGQGPTEPPVAMEQPVPNAAEDPLVNTI